MTSIPQNPKDSKAILDAQTDSILDLLNEDLIDISDAAARLDAIYGRRYLQGADIVDTAIEADRTARHGQSADAVALALEISYGQGGAR